MPRAAVAGAAKTIAKFSKGKETRVSWSLPENRRKMEAAVEGWARRVSMVRRARRMTADAEVLLPSTHLDIAMGDDQARVALNPTPQDYTMGAIMKSAGGSGGTIGLSKRKLDAMGGIRGQSCLLNSEERLEQMRMQLGSSGPADRREAVCEY